MWHPGSGSGGSSIRTGGRASTGSRWSRRHASSPPERRSFSTRSTLGRTPRRCGSGSTPGPRPWPPCSSRITFATSICSSGATAPRAFGPRLFWRDNIPDTRLQAIDPGNELPGGLLALYDGRGRNETPLWLPEQHALVFADALTAPGGELRVWATPWHEERVLPALRALLKLPFEHVIVSHGEPVHTRSDYGRALDRSPWSG